MCALRVELGRWLVQDRYCGNCGEELRADEQFCRGCGGSVPKTARASTPQASESAPSSPSLHVEAPTPPEERNEDTVRKRWWQTQPVRIVVALMVLAPVLMFFGLLVGDSGAWLIVLGVSLLIVTPVVGVAAVSIYFLVSELAGRRATGRDDDEPGAEANQEPLSEEERSRLLEQSTEISKLSFDYFKHFTTITTAAALVELALYQQLGLNKRSALLGVSMLGLTLVLCIIGLVRLSVGAAAKGTFSPIGRRLRGLMVSTAWFFLSGVGIFALAAVSPRVNTIISRILFEMASALAQNIR